MPKREKIEVTLSVTAKVLDWLAVNAIAIPWNRTFNQVSYGSREASMERLSTSITSRRSNQDLVKARVEFHGDELDADNEPNSLKSMLAPFQLDIDTRCASVDVMSRDRKVGDDE